MDVNPYAAPGAVVEDVGALSASDLESRKASRGQRLGAAMLDGVMIGVGAMLTVFSVGFAAETSGAPNIALILVGSLIMIGLFVTNCILLHRNGQTLGKRIVGIKVVRGDGSRIGLGRIILLRVIPISLLGGIPVIGGFISLADSLMIFGPERRCLHDIFADTIVISA
jgi:uncharacterized RDD family membrane protein YckC